MLLVALSAKSQNSEEAKIRERVKLFSSNLMEGRKKEVVDMYTKDAKIFPSNSGILDGKDLAEYWNPSNPSNWRTTYHKVTPVEIKVNGDEAYDYGHYEGTSSNGETESKWKGKYVIIWRKEEGIWKIYLDIWNPIK